jgi:hypothetical protein
MQHNVMHGCPGDKSSLINLRCSYTNVIAGSMASRAASACIARCYLLVDGGGAGGKEGTGVFALHRKGIRHHTCCLRGPS